MMFRILTAYMVVFCCFVLVAPVKADPRIELDTDTCHAPYDAVDTDNEYKLTCDGVLYETAADGAVRGWARVIKLKVPRGVEPENTEVSSLDSDATCTLRNDDGTEAQIEDWTVKIKSRCSRWGCTATFLIKCGYDDS